MIDSLNGGNAVPMTEWDDLSVPARVTFRWPQCQNQHVRRRQKATIGNATPGGTK